MEIIDIQSLVEGYFHENEMNDCFFIDKKINGKKIEVFISAEGFESSTSFFTKSNARRQKIYLQKQE